MTDILWDTVTSVFGFNLNINIKTGIIVPILHMIIHLYVSLNYNNCNVIRNKCSFDIFLAHRAFIYFLVLIEGIFGKNFYISDNENFLYKFMSLVPVILIKFIYLIRKKSLIQSLMLCTHYSDIYFFSK
ncbi:hypothetical protein CWI38_0046p0070 [Hamiltosporidium tvaerminnensis]|uniref:Uncharacterized protein n=1 Tax=Hamiltosporidium tvaerminnensis TaxID=1176355 RepID=A0A4Q9M1K8_9MICR|nr:hypothetical protein CWI38_0046p0070 [Hamiltosporidium tvaerminnensis]